MCPSALPATPAAQPATTLQPFTGLGMPTAVPHLLPHTLIVLGTDATGSVLCLMHSAVPMNTLPPAHQAKEGDWRPRAHIAFQSCSDCAVLAGDGKPMLQKGARGRGILVG